MCVCVCVWVGVCVCMCFSKNDTFIKKPVLINYIIFIGRCGLGAREIAWYTIILFCTSLHFYILAKI